MRLIRSALAVVASATLASCAMPLIDRGGGGIQAHSPDEIVYSISPCRGFCPAYNVRVREDGRATFEGVVHTATKGQVALRTNEGLFSDLARQLTAVRPDASQRTISHENCTVYATDQQVVSVIWLRAGKRISELTYDLGCQDEALAPLRRSLAEARRRLPIDALVGKPEQR